MAFKQKNPVNRNLYSLLSHSSIRKDDIVACPSCNSEDLREKLYIVNPELRSIEISGICGSCDKSFSTTAGISDIRDRSKEKQSQMLRRKKRQYDKLMARAEAYKLDIVKLQGEEDV